MSNRGAEKKEETNIFFVGTLSEKRSSGDCKNQTRDSKAC